MNPLIRIKIRTLLTGAAVLAGWLVICPNASAVNPAPDGGYPGNNTAEGQSALFSLTSGIDNTALGFQALFSNTTGNYNTAEGYRALFANTSGGQNTATGVNAMISNSTGYFNAAFGTNTLYRNTTGTGNTANGVQALSKNTTGSYNTAVGNQALLNNNAANYNTAVGVAALVSAGTGGATRAARNTAIGANALPNDVSGTDNIAIGFNAGANVTTSDNIICIGSAGANLAEGCFIDHIRGVTTANANAIPVVIDTAGQLGTMSSSRRFKTDIKPMDQDSEAILALEPVSFRYKEHTAGARQFGLIAEQVAEVNPDLVVRDKNGEIYTVRYEAVNAMLLNEFLKEHHKVEEQQAAIAQLEKDLGSVVARLKDQDLKIQKVSNQIKMKAKSQIVLND